MPGVLSMVEHVPPKLFNDVARELLGITAPQSGGANFPYTGQGQVVAVADTGLDERPPRPPGPDRRVVPFGRPGDTCDPHGHGTHVPARSWATGPPRAAVRGRRPEARLFFQSLLDATGGLGGLPLDLDDLFEEAYQAGARVHNNSWGAAAARSTR